MTDIQRQKNSARRPQGRVMALPPLLALLLAAPAAQAASNPPPVPSQPPLTAAQIVQLLTAKDYSFTSYGRPLRGTTHWDNTSHTVSGRYVYAGIISGSFQAEWNVVGDKSCTKDDHQGLLCSSVYAYGPGFMEVTSDGKVLAVSVPQ
jgi:hypothetical protein